MFLVKLQTAITFALVIKTKQILYWFGVEWNFFAISIVLVCNSVCSAKFVYVLVKLQTAITLALVIETKQILYQFGKEFNFLCNAYDASV